MQERFVAPRHARARCVARFKRESQKLGYASNICDSWSACPCATRLLITAGESGQPTAEQVRAMALCV